MQPELEKWIQEHRFPKDGNKRPEHQSFVIREADLRALLDGKVIASAEPVAWLCKSVDGLVDATASEFVRDDYARFKRDITPLYKAAEAGEGVITPRPAPALSRRRGRLALLSCSGGRA